MYKTQRKTDNCKIDGGILETEIAIHVNIISSRSVTMKKYSSFALLALYKSTNFNHKVVI